MGARIIHERSRKVALGVNFYLTHPGADDVIWDPSKTQHCVDTLIVFRPFSLEILPHLNMSPALPNPAAET